MKRLNLPALILFALSITAAGCNSNQVETEKNSFDISQSLVPMEKIFQGGPPRDGIPSLDDPKFIKAGDASYLSSEDEVLGIEVGGKARAYPVKIMNWHELAHDSMGGLDFVVTYCPLANSAAAYKAEVSGKKARFGVSGLIYNSNLLMFDRDTESLWSQIMGSAITGSSRGNKLSPLPLSRMTWKGWLERYPNTEVLSMETGFDRDYGKDVYEEYHRSERIMFAVTSKPPSEHRAKDIVVGLKVDKSFRAYPYSALEAYGRPEFKEEIGGATFTVRWDAQARSAEVYDEKGERVPTLTSYLFSWFALHPTTSFFGAR